jgi:hypothetical protein
MSVQVKVYRNKLNYRLGYISTVFKFMKLIFKSLALRETNVGMTVA